MRLSVTPILCVLLGIFSCSDFASAEEPIGLLSLEMSEEDWMKPFGMCFLKSTVMLHEKAVAGKIAVEVWEPGDTSPRYHDEIQSWALKAPANMAWSFKVTFFPDNVKQSLAKGKFPAWIELRQDSSVPGEKEPVSYITEQRLKLPESYPDVRDSIVYFQLTATTNKTKIPLCHLVVNRDGHAMHTGTSPEEVRKKNPYFTHVIFYLIPIWEPLPALELPQPKTEETVSKLLPIGSKAPDWAVESGTDKRVGSEATKGKIVVLNFWATHCVPCLEEMPDLIKIQREFGEDKVVIAGLSLDRDKTPQQLEKFGARRLLNYPVGLAGAEASKKFGISAMPTTYIVDQEGTIRFVKEGQVSYEELSREIKDLMK